MVTLMLLKGMYTNNSHKMKVEGYKNIPWFLFFLFDLEAYKSMSVGNLFTLFWNFKYS